MIDPKNWKWFGTPGHFIASSHCRFHMCTQVGKYIVSTVGEYVPDSQSWDSYAGHKGVTLKGRGDEREHDFLTRVGYVEIGYGRKYETMVFEAGEVCKRPDCNCGLPEISGSEVDMEPYNERKDATEGHRMLCLKWAEMQTH